MTSTIQSLCISIPETWLHVALKRRAEISADIFARLLRYFFLSCKNLTITLFTVILDFFKLSDSEVGTNIDDYAKVGGPGEV